KSDGPCAQDESQHPRHRAEEPTDPERPEVPHDLLVAVDEEGRDRVVSERQSEEGEREEPGADVLDPDPTEDAIEDEEHDRQPMPGGYCGWTPTLHHQLVRHYAEGDNRRDASQADRSHANAVEVDQERHDLDE